MCDSRLKTFDEQGCFLYTRWHLTSLRLPKTDWIVEVRKVGKNLTGMVLSKRVVDGTNPITRVSRKPPGSGVLRSWACSLFRLSENTESVGNRPCSARFRYYDNSEQLNPPQMIFGILR